MARRGRATPDRSETAPINATWHRAHRLPKRPSVDERIAWHLEHATMCRCRPIPPTLEREIARRALAPTP